MAEYFQFRNNDIIRHAFHYDNNSYIHEGIYYNGGFYKIDENTGSCFPTQFTLKDFVRASLLQAPGSHQHNDDELMSHLKRNVMVMTSEKDSSGYTYWIRFTKRTPPSSTQDQDTGQLVSSHPLHWRFSNTTRWPRIHYWLPPHERDLDLKVVSKIYDVWTTSYGTYDADTNIVSFFDGCNECEVTLREFVRRHLSNSGWGDDVDNDPRDHCQVRKHGSRKWRSMRHITIVG